MKLFILFLFFGLISSVLSQAPYAPAADEEGSSAIVYNDTRFVNWAINVEIYRGYINIEDTTAVFQGSNRASFGKVENAVGPANKNTSDVVSLGDSGIAIITFQRPITNGAGYDFAVFENGFYDKYLELAHVEVSSDGIHFVRFPSHSLTESDNNIGNGGLLSPTNLYNLAGKYRIGFGTPFDLEELKDSSNIDINKITHVKLIDVVGTIGGKGTKDSYGNTIIDPFPTPFASGGFDLNAVGVIHEYNELGLNVELLNFIAYPNPSSGKINIELDDKKVNELLIYNSTGKIIKRFNIKQNQSTIQLKLPHGIYFIKALGNEGHFNRKIIIR